MGRELMDEHVNQLIRQSLGGRGNNNLNNNSDNNELKINPNTDKNNTTISNKHLQKQQQQ